jgi:hypothetical protein
MAAFKTNQGTVPQDMVAKVGTAAGRVARIQQEYAVQAEATTITETREVLASEARAAAERVIDEQGISIEDYNTVLGAAETDPELESQLLNAAREVF